MKASSIDDAQPVICIEGRGNNMNMYKTQNVHFDIYKDSVKVGSQQQLLQSIGHRFEETSLVKANVITKALEKEMRDRGFSLINGVLVCNARLLNITQRKTMLMKLAQPLSIDLGQGLQVTDIVAVTLSPDSLGVLNLRYLSRLTRLFSDKDLADNLRSVNSVDGMKILLNDNDFLEAEIAAA